MDVRAIAEVCHEANRAYCSTLGDLSQKPWREAPEWQKESAINGVNFHLSVLRGGGTPSPSASHENWMTEKLVAGWKYGPIKDEVKKEHPCFVPYEQLPTTQKTKDLIFCGIVEAFFKSGGIQ